MGEVLSDPVDLRGDQVSCFHHVRQCILGHLIITVITSFLYVRLGLPVQTSSLSNGLRCSGVREVDSLEGALYQRSLV